MATLGREGLRLADMLFELGAIKFGAFRLKLHETQPDAPLSPIYLMLRTKDHPKNPGPLTFEAMELIGDLFGQVLSTSGAAEYRRYVGIPNAGEPFADQIGRIWDGMYNPPTRLRLKKTEQDRRRRISDSVEGEYEPGGVVLVVDDLITQADSKLEAIRTLEAKGLVVKDVLVLVDRMQGGREQLEEVGYRLHSVFTLERLLLRYVDTGVIDASKADEVRQYLAANRL